MTFPEIEARLAEILATLHDKGHDEASIHIAISPAARLYVYVNCPSIPGSPFFFYADEPGPAMDGAAAWAAKLPAPEAAAMATYRNKLGKALDFATEAALPPTITAGARQSMTAVSERLIEKE
ncbi:hypothetical protein [Herbaspirillum sp.]|uniref:hypothetical protein n=1 Tax=Herbaspirillum sp. TaxID=1890675 RepID=UPI00259011F2|nr:hypothetical protein [Herbaspirillum sp.]MCP3947346.1 hypothetical protein [Herbaspirillum sp.]